MLQNEENRPVRNIPFSPPDISEEEIREVADALRSGWITTGPKTKKLEALAAEYVGAAKSVCMNSQTACAETVLRILGIGPGDEVILPAYTYTATASVVCHVGATPVMIDCQADSLEMDYDAMEAAITEKTKVIIPVDLAGIPCDYDRIFAAAENKRHLFRPANELQAAYGRVIVAADGAHSFGASRKGVMAGSIADFTNFSFHAVKNFTTAEGGAMTWRHVDGVDDAEIYKKAQLLSLHGQSKDALAKTQLGAWEYDIVGTWYKCNMTDVAAAIGLAQFGRYPGMLQRRRQLIELYNAALRPAGIETLDHYTDAHTSSGHLYLTRIPGITALQRNEIILRMAEQGVATNVHYKPLPMHTAYKNLGFDIADFPNAYAHFANEITLPLYSTLSDDNAAYVAERFLAATKEFRK